jgi:hypothetical protein
VTEYGRRSLYIEGRRNGVTSMVLLDLVLCNESAILAGKAGMNRINGKESNGMTDTYRQRAPHWVK